MATVSSAPSWARSTANTCRRTIRNRELVSAAAQVTQLRGAKIIPSPQTEISEHEKDDDNGTD
jgi:hypothetical protein